MPESHEFDPFDLNSQREKAVEDEAAEKLRRQIEVSDLKWLMAHKQGRRLMNRLLGITGVYRLSFTGQAPLTDFNEGKRNVGLILLSDAMEHCPERFNDMLLECKK